MKGSGSGLQVDFIVCSSFGRRHSFRAVIPLITLTHYLQRTTFGDGKLRIPNVPCLSYQILGFIDFLSQELSVFLTSENFLFTQFAVSVAHSWPDYGRILRFTTTVGRCFREEIIIIPMKSNNPPELLPIIFS